jgi:hypothetical protein
MMDFTYRLIVDIMLITCRSAAFNLIPSSRIQTSYQCTNRALYQLNLSEVSENENSGKDVHSLNGDEAMLQIMDVLSANFKSHALHAFVNLDIANIMGDKQMSTSEIANELCKSNQLNANGGHQEINQDALYRTLRLLTTINEVDEGSRPALKSSCNNGKTQSSEIEVMTFKLTALGKFLETGKEESLCDSNEGIRSCLLHWMEKPLFQSWYQLPTYILGSQVDPFTLANDVSSDNFYNKNDNPQSLEYANKFVKSISDIELNGISRSLDWSAFGGKRIVDIGGYNGKLLGRIASSCPNTNLTLKSLDLPEVIRSIDEATVPTNVQLIEGDIMQPSTIPQCDVILMKHFLDRCMWTEEQTIEILKTCSKAVARDGAIIICEAVIPSFDDISKNEGREESNVCIALDSLYMLVGRDRQRTKLEWGHIVEQAGLQLTRIIRTKSPTCSMILLKKNGLD